MSINIIPIVAGTIPYPDVENNEIMHDYIFDDNNKALLDKTNEIITRFNNLIETINSITDSDSGANNIRATAISGLSGTNVQTLLEALHTEITEVVTGTLPDASVTAAKLAADVLTLLDTTIEDYISDMTTLVPIGSIIMFTNVTPPTGYLECDGTEISRSTYSDLFDVIGTTFGEGNSTTTFNLPDMRGEFVRGYDNGRGIDAGRTFGSFQDENTNVQNATFYGSVSPGGSSAANALINNNEIRPRNIALMLCIKY